jgi:hypothetical protein
VARVAKILYRASDAEGWLWDVREERDTDHGFPLLLGWPFGVPRGKGGAGGPAAIPTVELVAYLNLHRENPAQMTLPLGPTAIKRLRRQLGHDRYADRATWWEERIEDLFGLTGQQFVIKHGANEGSASLWRRRLGADRRARSADWWRDPKVLKLLRSGMSTYALAHVLQVSTHLAWSGKQRAEALDVT